MNDSEKAFWTVPNLLSLLRIALVPLFVWCFFSAVPHARVWAVAVFLTAGATDVVDGWIARHFHQVSLAGRILDPLADKLMVFAALACLMLDGTLPLWLVLLYFCGVFLLVATVILPSSSAPALPASAPSPSVACPPSGFPSTRPGKIPSGTGQAPCNS